MLVADLELLESRRYRLDPLEVGSGLQVRRRGRDMTGKSALRHDVSIQRTHLQVARGQSTQIHSLDARIRFSRCIIQILVPQSNR
jgi:hypothetical protein